MHDDHTNNSGKAQPVELEVLNGELIVHAEDGEGKAQLTWPADLVVVTSHSDEVDLQPFEISPGTKVSALAVSDPAYNEYRVQVEPDRMSATMKVIRHQGVERKLADQSPTSSLALRVLELRIEPEPPTLQEALSALQDAGVVYGVDEDAVAKCVASPGSTSTVATGLAPVEGNNGYVEQLVDFKELFMVGVLAGTPLARRVRKIEGTDGRDVSGGKITVVQVRDARLRVGVGASIDEEGILVISTVNGAPTCDAEGKIEVMHELVLSAVDSGSGDVNFTGSIRVEGNVGEGRTVTAQNELHVVGSVDRAHLESGASLTVEGPIMSSVLRAGADRALAATIADRVLTLPRMLGIVAAQARQFRDASTDRGQELSHGLSIQLVLENMHRSVLQDIASVLHDLKAAGSAYQKLTHQVAGWLKRLSTAANMSLTQEEYQDILVEVGALASEVQRACDEPSNLHVSYMQASEAEATGVVTVSGKGIYNSRIVAAGGLESKQYEAVLRGGSILSHGRVFVHELGSPAGVTTLVQLGSGAELNADRAYAGTVITGPGYSHRFVADRRHIHVKFDGNGAMNVESLAA